MPLDTGDRIIAEIIALAKTAASEGMASTAAVLNEAVFALVTTVHADRRAEAPDSPGCAAANAGGPRDRSAGCLRIVRA